MTATRSTRTSTPAARHASRDDRRRRADRSPRGRSRPTSEQGSPTLRSCGPPSCRQDVRRRSPPLAGDRGHWPPAIRAWRCSSERSTLVDRAMVGTGLGMPTSNRPSRSPVTRCHRHRCTPGWPASGSPRSRWPPAGPATTASSPPSTGPSFLWWRPTSGASTAARRLRGAPVRPHLGAQRCRRLPARPPCRPRGGRTLRALLGRSGPAARPQQVAPAAWHTPADRWTRNQRLVSPAGTSTAVLRTACPARWRCCRSRRSRVSRSTAAVLRSMSPPAGWPCTGHDGRGGPDWPNAVLGRCEAPRRLRDRCRRAGRPGATAAPGVARAALAGRARRSTTTSTATSPSPGHAGRVGATAGRAADHQSHVLSRHGRAAADHAAVRRRHRPARPR